VLQYDVLYIKLSFHVYYHHRFFYPFPFLLLDRTDDIGKALWLCLKHKKCILCGKPADIHHVQAIGMGMDRKTYDDSKHEKIALCREHHTEAHATGWKTFSKKYHVYGIIYNVFSYLFHLNFPLGFY